MTFYYLDGLQLPTTIGMLHELTCYTPQKNLRTSTYVFPLFNTESLIFKIENIFLVQWPFEIISKQDRQLVHIKSFQNANGVNNIRPTDSEKFENL